MNIARTIMVGVLMATANLIATPEVTDVVAKQRYPFRLDTMTFATFDGLPVTFEPDGEGGWKVTVTNDVNQIVQFTDDLGDVELDLNGHSIAGAVASAGIKVIHGAGTGTHLHIVDLQMTGTAMVKGGDAVTSGGNGGAGVDVATNAVNVLISVGEKVTIKGGDGGLGAYDFSIRNGGGAGGMGGAGINGVVCENSGIILGGDGGEGGGAELYGPGGIGGVGGIGVQGTVGTNTATGVILGGDGGKGGWAMSPGPGGFGGSGANGMVTLNNGIITGGDGGDVGNGDEGSGTGGFGGNGVSGVVTVNNGIVTGGDGGDGYGGCGYGGTGGAGVQGTIGTNTVTGVITGGDGGGGNEGACGGNGVSGMVTLNDGIVTGGNGGVGWAGGGGGNGINGDVDKNGGVISGGNGGCPHNIWDERAGSGGLGLAGNVEVDEGTISDGASGGATVIAGGCYTYDGNGHDLIVVISNLPPWYAISSVTVDGGDVTPVDLGDGSYEARQVGVFTDAGIYSRTVCVVATNTVENYVNAKEFTATVTIKGPDVIVEQVTPHDGIYDGEGHGITVTVTKPAGAVVKYAYAEQGPYFADAILFTNVTETAVTVWYTVEAANYASVTNSGTVKISPKTLTQGMVGAIGNHPYTGKAQTPKPTVTDAERGVTLREDVEYTLSYASNTAVGEGIVTVTGKGNYTGVIARMFVIEPSVVSKLEEILGGAGKVEPDGEGGWIVTLTNDVDSADLPLEIPDNLGNVTFDLNGHDLIGGDGQPAIVIVPGEGDGVPTVLTIVTGGDDATVLGGEGAPAIEVQDDAQDGVLINIGEGVTVQGGGDDVPAIIGEVGTNEGTIIEPGGIHIPGEGSVTVPKTWKTDQKVTWKAVAAKGSVFAHWEGAFVDSRMLSKNERRNPSLAFPVPPGFDTNGIRAVFIAVDDDRLGKLALSQSGPLAPNVDVAGLELVDDSESYVTASVSGLPTGLKFDAKTLAITGTPTKPGMYTVKITAKNASGYQWAENVQLRVADIEDARIGFGGLPAEGTVGAAYAGQIAAGEFTKLSANGLPSGLKFDTKSGAVAGIPTKGGYYTVTVTANYPDKTKATATWLMTISPVAAVPEPKRTAYHPLTVLSTNTAAGTATGTGVYAAGKKVSISAKPAKGWVFAGWYRDMKLKEPMAFASADGRTASQSVVVPEARYLFARFATEAEDIESLKVAVADAVTGADGTYSLDLGACVESLSLPKLAVTGLPAGLKYDAKTLKVTGQATKPGVYTVKVAATNTSVKKATDETTATFTITVPNFESDRLPGLLSSTDAYGTLCAGVALDPDLIDCTPANGWTVKLAGLPTGLKYDTKTGKIAGVPTAKPGSYTVTFTASKKGEANQVATITLNIEALPAWAVGTFDGAAYVGDSANASGIVQAFTVAANGKISGKLLEGGQTWTLSAGEFSRVEDVEGSDVFYATVIGKAGKEVVTNEVTVAASDVSGLTASALSLSWQAFQNLWKRANTKANMPVIKKNIDKVLELGDPRDANNMLTLTFKKDGAVTFAGKVDGNKVSGSSQLVRLAGDGSPYQVTLYAPPKPPFEGWCAMFAVELTTDGQNIVTEVTVK